MSSTGQRNKNPLNVKGSDNWRGVVGRDGRGHCIFSDPAYGWRAALITLRTYYMTHKLRSIYAILSRWAPVSDTIGSIPGAPSNSPSAYAKFVAKRMGVGINDKLPLFDRRGKIKDGVILRELVKAMAVYENGVSYRPVEADLDSGFALSGLWPKDAPAEPEEFPEPSPEPVPPAKPKERMGKRIAKLFRGFAKKFSPRKKRPTLKGRWPS